MKKYILGFAALLLLGHCFAQVQVKKPITSTTVIHTNENVAPKVNNGVKIIPGPKFTKQTIPDYKNATLVDVLITVTTGTKASVEMFTGSVSSDNKDGDTHWSCGTFDQSNTDITSFHDNSDNDVYECRSVKTLQMTVDKAAKMSDFANIGRYHINIAPKGNDTWNIYEVTLTMDFDNPKSQQKLKWNNITLDQDHRDVDLYFHFDGRNLVVNP